MEIDAERPDGGAHMTQHEACSSLFAVTSGAEDFLSFSVKDLFAGCRDRKKALVVSPFPSGFWQRGAKINVAMTLALPDVFSIPTPSAGPFERVAIKSPATELRWPQVPLPSLTVNSEDLRARVVELSLATPQ
jgi:hypothetical protein